MLLKYPFLWAACAFALGIVAGNWWGGEAALPFLPLLGAAAGAIIMLAAGFFTRRRNAFLLGGVLFLCLMGAARLFVADTLWARASHWAVGAEGTFTATVMAPPSVQNGYARYLVDLESLRYADGERADVSGRLYAYDTAPRETFRVGDRISMTGKVTPIRLYHNPGKIDLTGRYRSLRLLGRLYPSDGTPGFAFVEDSGRCRLERWAQDVKEKLSAAFAPYMDSARLPVLMTLLFGGAYGDIPTGVMSAFSATGIVHILSVSGSHVALLFGFLYLLGGWLRLPARLTLGLAAGFVILYAFLAGLVPPVIRAVAMGLLAAGGVFLGRERVGLNLLAAAVLFMLLADPYYLSDVSFQLSVGASAGILLFYGPLRDFFGRIPRLPHIVRDSIALSTAAQVLTIPIILYDFHVFPLYFIPANLFVTPLLEWAIIAGLLAALVSLLFTPLMAGILYVADYLLLIAIHGNGWLASLPRASAGVGGLSLWESAAYYGGVALAWFHREILTWKWKWGPIAAEAGLLAACVALRLTAPPAVLYAPDLGLDRGALLASGPRTVLYYKAGNLPGYTAQWEWNSFLGYEGIFAADILLLNLEEAESPIPLTMTCPVKEIWVTGGDAETLAPGLVRGSAARVRQLGRARLGYGNLAFTTNGSGWLVTEGDRGVYFAGSRAMRTEFPAHTLWFTGGSGFRDMVTVDALAAIHPEAVILAGSRKAGEDRDLLELHGVPCADLWMEGMKAVVFDGTWTITK